MPAMSQSWRSCWRALCQINHAMLLASRVGRKNDDLVCQVVGEIVDVLDLPGEGVAEQFADRLDIGISHAPDATRDEWPCYSGGTDGERREPAPNRSAVDRLAALGATVVGAQSALQRDRTLRAVLRTDSGMLLELARDIVRENDRVPDLVSVEDVGRQCVAAPVSGADIGVDRDARHDVENLSGSDSTERSALVYLSSVPGTIS